MSLWKTILAYDGTPFHGWQIQTSLPTVQGTLAQAIEHVTGIVTPGADQILARSHAGGHGALFQRRLIAFQSRLDVFGAQL